MIASRASTAGRPFEFALSSVFFFTARQIRPKTQSGHPTTTSKMTPLIMATLGAPWMMLVSTFIQSRHLYEIEAPCPYSSRLWEAPELALLGTTPKMRGWWNEAKGAAADAALDLRSGSSPPPMRGFPREPKPTQLIDWSGLDGDYSGACGWLFLETTPAPPVSATPLALPSAPPDSCRPAATALASPRPGIPSARL